MACSYCACFWGDTARTVTVRDTYLAAFNAKLSARTTPENNIVVGIGTLVPGEIEHSLLRQPEEERDNESIQSNFSLQNCHSRVGGNDGKRGTKSILSFFGTQTLSAAL